MPKLISVASFTTQSVANGAFMTALPDFYKLKDVVESQAWHDNQTVFDHCIKSAIALEEIVQFDYLKEEEKTKLSAYLTAESRLGLLRLATLFHDVGKLISLQRNARGDTSSPSHGSIGGWLAEPLVASFAVTEQEKKTILSLITDHLVASDLIEMAINNHTEPNKVVALLQTHRPDLATELLVLAYADWQGCDIRQAVREEREKRIAFVHECLSLVASRM